MRFKRKLYDEPIELLPKNQLTNDYIDNIRNNIFSKIEKTSYGDSLFSKLPKLDDKPNNSALPYYGELKTTQKELLEELFLNSYVFYKDSVENKFIPGIIVGVYDNFDVLWEVNIKYSL